MRSSLLLVSLPARQRGSRTPHTTSERKPNSSHHRGRQCDLVPPLSRLISPSPSRSPGPFLCSRGTARSPFLLPGNAKLISASVPLHQLLPCPGFSASRTALAWLLLILWSQLKCRLHREPALGTLSASLSIIRPSSLVVTARVHSCADA